MNIGAHVSMAGGLDKAIDRGEKLNATCIQSFASSPRSYRVKPTSSEVIDSYLEKKDQSQIKLHIFHGIYLINLAHVKPNMVGKATESLIGYQQLAGKINGFGTVFHVGSHKGKGLDQYLEQIAAAIITVLEQTPTDVKLLLENTAGQSGAIGKDFQELAQIFAAVESQGGSLDKLGVCLDTQHAHAAGYDFSTESGRSQLLSEIDQQLGLDYLKLIHVNDSKSDQGSNLDRHANLGQGTIPTAGLKQFLRHQAIKDLPLILEVPGKNKSGPRPQDVQALRDLIND